MAMIRHLSDSGKEFSEAFEQLCRTRSRWQAWSDFISMSAYSISNAIDSVHREAREADYPRIAERYTDKEMEAVARLLSTTVMALEENPDQDFLGDLYMRMELGNDRAGQFFTPYSVCRLMSEINAGTVEEQVKDKGYITVNDCCVGGGALLIAFANTCKRKGVNYQNHVLFIAQDIDYTVAMMAYIQLSLLGCAGYVVVGDSLSQPLTGHTLYAPMDRITYITPMYCSDMWNMRRLWHGITSLQQPVESPEIIPKNTPKKPNEYIQMSLFDFPEVQDG